SQHAAIAVQRVIQAAVEVPARDRKTRGTAGRDRSHLHDLSIRLESKIGRLIQNAAKVNGRFAVTVKAEIEAAVEVESGHHELVGGAGSAHNNSAVRLDRDRRRFGGPGKSEHGAFAVEVKAHVQADIGVVRRHENRAGGASGA